MDNKLMIFEGKEVEVFELNGIVYFNPYHVGACLGLKESAVRMAIKNMNEKQAVKLTDSIVKDIDFRKIHSTGENFLTESGVYKLVFRSNKPKAEKFTDWVTDEVLPSIRKEGKYIVEQTLKSVSIASNNNPLQQQKEKLKKAVITSNYLIDYIGSSNGLVPDDILNNFTTVIQAVNIDIIDHLRNMNKIQQTQSHH